MTGCAGKRKTEGGRWLSRLKGLDEMPVYPSILAGRRKRSKKKKRLEDVEPKPFPSGGSYARHEGRDGRDPPVVNESISQAPPSGGKKKTRSRTKAHIGKGKGEGVRWLQRLKGLEKMRKHRRILRGGKVRGMTIRIDLRSVMKWLVWLYVLTASSVYLFFGDGLRDLDRAVEGLALSVLNM